MTTAPNPIQGQGSGEGGKDGALPAPGVRTEAAAGATPVVDAKAQAREERRRELVGIWEQKYTATHQEEGAQAVFQGALDKLNGSKDPDEIISIQEQLGIPYSHLLEYLKGDPLLSDVAREKATRATQQLLEWTDPLLRQSSSPDDDTEMDQDALKQIQGFREVRDEMIGDVLTLFRTDVDEAERKDAAVSLAMRKVQVPGANEMTLEEYFAQYYGYTDEPDFFTDVEALIPAKAEAAKQAKKDRTGEEDHEDDEATKGMTYEEASKKITEASGGKEVMDALEEARAVAANPNATDEEKEAARQKLLDAVKGKEVKEGTKEKRRTGVVILKNSLVWVGIPLAIVVIPVLLMLSIQGMGGGK